MRETSADPPPHIAGPSRPNDASNGTSDVIPASVATDIKGRPLPAQPDAPGPAPTTAVLATPSSDGVIQRALKLVLTLRPGEGVVYHALIALGADGCDPLLRCTDVTDLPAALDQAAALAAEADAHWQRQPRYPHATVPGPVATGNRSGAGRHPGTASEIATAAPPVGVVPTPPSEQPDVTPASKPSSSGQLSLFG